MTLQNAKGRLEVMLDVFAIGHGEHGDDGSYDSGNMVHVCQSCAEDDWDLGAAVSPSGHCDVCVSKGSMPVRRSWNDRSKLTSDVAGLRAMQTGDHKHLAFWKQWVASRARKPSVQEWRSHKAFLCSKLPHTHFATSQLSISSFVHRHPQMQFVGSCSPRSTGAPGLRSTWPNAKRRAASCPIERRLCVR